ncbi:MAG: hypothetical protein JRI59_08405 [Deltaproteobacteria bacterium]|nr:hypothetical protein [Deltaproteobacteria bacterium]
MARNKEYYLVSMVWPEYNRADKEGFKAKKEAVMEWRKKILQRFPKFDGCKFKTEKAAQLYMGRIKKVFPGAPIRVNGPLYDLIEFFWIPARKR